MRYNMLFKKKIQHNHASKKKTIMVQIYKYKIDTYKGVA